MKKRAIVLAGLLILAASAHAQQVIRLYAAAAPGSEAWTNQEKEYFSPIFNTQVVTNVAQPTLTAFLPEAEKANGTAVIIAPGGGFYALSINGEGVNVAKWLNGKGVTAFVLKYRLVPTGEDGVKEFIAKVATKQKKEIDTEEVIPMAIADGLAAVKYVREHAADFKISPQRVGIMGFSAGGTVAASAALQYAAESRPDFAAPVYAYLPEIKQDVPKDAPPLFIVAATDDQLGLAPHSVNLYSKWIAAKKSAELHLYSRGGHGFGLGKKELPSGHWIERFSDWLEVRGLLKPSA